MPAGFRRYNKRKVDSMQKLRIGLVGTYQESFDDVTAKQIYYRSVDELGQLEEKLGFDLVPVSELLVTADDAKRARAELEANAVDFLLCQVSSFAAGDIILPLAKMNAKLGLWAVPESTDSGPLPLNSFCGVNMYASIISHYLKDYGINYKWFFGNIEDELFRARFEPTVQALRAVKNLKEARIALVGGVAPGFRDLNYDPRILERIYGVEIHSLELAEVLDKVGKFDESQVRATADRFASLGTRADALDRDYEHSARLYLAFQELAEEQGYSAFAISCWPELQTRYQLKPCSVLGQLNHDNLVAACEGDVPSALSMLILNFLNEERSTLMDLSKFDREDETVLMWHCGCAAPCWADGKLEHRQITNGREDLRDFGLGNYCALKAGPATVMRVTGEGEKMLVFTGEFVEDQKQLYNGSNGWMGNLRINREPLTALDLVNTIMVYGFQHHFPIAFGELHEALMEFGAWLGLKMLGPVKYQDYLQTI
jgi:L-fucose isomerase-like protein